MMTGGPANSTASKAFSLPTTSNSRNKTFQFIFCGIQNVSIHGSISRLAILQPLRMDLSRLMVNDMYIHVLLFFSKTAPRIYLLPTALLILFKKIGAHKIISED